MTNKKIIADFQEDLWGNRRLEVIDDVFLPDAVIHSPLNTKQGSCTMREIADKWLTAFPDLHVTVDELIAEGDKVVSRWRGLATHMGSFFDTMPTHHEVVYSGVTTYRMVEGKVAEYWALVDMHAILTQLGCYKHISELVE